MVCIKGDNNTQVVGNNNIINNHYYSPQKHPPLTWSMKIYRNNALNVLFFVSNIFFLILTPLWELSFNWTLIIVLSSMLIWFMYLPAKFPRWFYTAIYTDKVHYCGQTIYFEHLHQFGVNQSYFWYTLEPSRNAKIIHFENNYQAEYLLNRTKNYKQYHNN